MINLEEVLATARLSAGYMESESGPFVTEEIEKLLLLYSTYSYVSYQIYSLQKLLISKPEDSINLNNVNIRKPFEIGFLDGLLLSEKLQQEILDQEVGEKVEELAAENISKREYLKEEFSKYFGFGFQNTEEERLRILQRLKNAKNTDISNEILHGNICGFNIFTTIFNKHHRIDDEKYFETYLKTEQIKSLATNLASKPAILAYMCGKTLGVTIEHTTSSMPYIKSSWADTMKNWIVDWIKNDMHGVYLSDLIHKDIKKVKNSIKQLDLSSENQRYNFAQSEKMKMIIAGFIEAQEEINSQIEEVKNLEDLEKTELNLSEEIQVISKAIEDVNKHISTDEYPWKNFVKIMQSESQNLSQEIKLSTIPRKKIRFIKEKIYTYNQIITDLKSSKDSIINVKSSKMGINILKGTIFNNLSIDKKDEIGKEVKLLFQSHTKDKQRSIEEIYQSILEDFEKTLQSEEDNLKKIEFVQKKFKKPNYTAHQEKKIAMLEKELKLIDKTASYAIWQLAGNEKIILKARLLENLQQKLLDKEDEKKELKLKIANEKLKFAKLSSKSKKKMQSKIEKLDQALQKDESLMSKALMLKTKARKNFNLAMQDFTRAVLYESERNEKRIKTIDSNYAEYLSRKPEKASKAIAKKIHSIKPSNDHSMMTQYLNQSHNNLTKEKYDNLGMVGGFVSKSIINSEASKLEKEHLNFEATKNENIKSNLKKLEVLYKASNNFSNSIIFSNSKSAYKMINTYKKQDVSKV